MPAPTDQVLDLIFGRWRSQMALVHVWTAPRMQELR